MSNQSLVFSEIAVKRTGNFPNRSTIVFLHDSLGCIELWRDFPERVGALTQCNVLVYDRQGYGKSCGFSYAKRDINYLELEAEILNQLLDYWNIEHPILFGHSDGGSIALLTAAKYPEKIKAIITEGAHVFVEDITIEGIKEAVQRYETTDLKSKLEKYHGSNTENMFWAWANTWTTEEFRSWNIEHFLPMIQCSTLVIQGEKDEYGTLKQVESIVEKVSGAAETFIIPNSGHSPHKENPEVVLKQVIAYIEHLR